MNLPKELYAALTIVVGAAVLLLVKAFTLKDEAPDGETAPPPTREEALRAARANALRQIEVLQSPVRTRDKTGFSLQQIERLQAVVAGIDAELAG